MRKLNTLGINIKILQQPQERLTSSFVMLTNGPILPICPSLYLDCSLILYILANSGVFT